MGEWIKSSYSNTDGGSCVEWSPGSVSGGTVPVRDSKDPGGPVLNFEVAGWMAFVNTLKAGGFPQV